MRKYLPLIAIVLESRMATLVTGTAGLDGAVCPDLVRAEEVEETAVAAILVSCIPLLEAGLF